MTKHSLVKNFCNLCIFFLLKILRFTHNFFVKFAFGKGLAVICNMFTPERIFSWLFWIQIQIRQRVVSSCWDDCKTNWFIILEILLKDKNPTCCLQWRMNKQFIMLSNSWGMCKLVVHFVFFLSQQEEQQEKNKTWSLLVLNSSLGSL